MDQLPGRRVVVALVGLAAIGLIGGYGVAIRGRPKSTAISFASPTPEAGRSARTIYVHVGGAVHRPGLHELPPGSRVADAIDAAGGPTDDANLDALNLAAKVKDGDKVLVPSHAEGVEGGAQVATSGAPPGSGQSAQINLNTATIAELDTLPGIGPALAQRIIDYRESHGGFRSVDELDNVSGIGPTRLDELRPLVTV